MKLELKHPTPYLPHNLQVLHDGIIWKLFSIATENIPLEKGHLVIGLFHEHHGHNDVALDEIKPILRPLSDLTKEIEHNGEKFVPFEVLAIKLFVNTSIEKDLLVGEMTGIPYWVMEWLFEWHFDVFNLIPEGLATDINTLNN